MKKIVSIALVLIMFCAVGYGVISTSKKTSLSPKQEKREQREQRRAARQAAFERSIDSLVQTHTFRFHPNTMQQQIAGPMKLITNPNFEVALWDGAADIFLPYIDGVVPPYHYTTINYSVPSLSGYITEQTKDGWMVTFKSSLFSTSTYTFEFEINSRVGWTQLTLKNPWYETVMYTGSISRM